MKGFNNAIFVVGKSIDKSEGILYFEDYYNNKENNYEVKINNVVGNFYDGCPTLLYQNPSENKFKAIIV